MILKKTILAIKFIFFLNLLFSQGLKINNPIIIKNRHTLEKYLPYVHNQIKNECLAYSLTTCRTILYARDNDIKDINEISYESFSPHYSYIIFKRETNDTIDEFMKEDYNAINEFGFYKIKNLEFPNYYPFTNNHIHSFPDLNVLKKDALKYKFSKIDSINMSDPNKEKIIKHYLCKDNPAVVGFSTWPDNLYPISKSWNEVINNDNIDTKTNFDTAGGHAVVLIGYDDTINGGSFLILNSWGNDFGNNGKMWVSYNNFFKEEINIHFVFSNQTLDSLIDNHSKEINEIKGLNPQRQDLIPFDWSVKLPILKKLGHYKGDTLNDGKRNAKGEFISLNNITYSGNWKNDVPQGSGNLIIDTNFVYSVDWKNQFNSNEISQIGTWNYSNGGKSVGAFKNNLLIGFGTQYNKSGKIVYRGEWKNGKINGYGIKYYKSGEKEYEGEWKNDKMNGSGTYYYFESGEKYIGLFKDNLFDGNGIRYYKSGEKKYEGEWKNDKMNGAGIFYYEPGGKYIGAFKDDLFNGNGIRYYKSGEKEYEGEWKNDKMNGSGTYYRESGEKYIGAFKDDLFNGNGISYYKSGEKEYEGEWENSKMNGNGIFYYESGEKYIGAFKDGLFNGNGISYSKSGEKEYEGEWKNDEMNGQGIFYIHGKKHYEGEWLNGKKHGKGIEYYENGSIYRSGVFKNGEFVK
ncbi:MAG: hypothetical protein CL846_02130 [Crocinitomicaceae bacterium]|nr:hypothetical protein [Crocinitomicaceae bacterium]|tara:strand:+ start:630 stop:2687 length:2058 start_codon:yes stop_codon:yes gene_type:complete